MRTRYWQQRADRYVHSDGAMQADLQRNTGNFSFSSDNLDRMRAGRAPRDEAGRPIELSHVIPRSHGGPNSPLNLHEVTQVQHARIDAHRVVPGVRTAAGMTFVPTNVRG